MSPRCYLAPSRRKPGAVTPAEGSLTGCSRAKLPHWITQSGTCDTREVVLERDGVNVTTDSSCAATGGSWHSPYDGATWTAPSDVDIDHIVPLAEAWRSGANNWTTPSARASPTA